MSPLLLSIRASRLGVTLLAAIVGPSAAPLQHHELDRFAGTTHEAIAGEQPTIQFRNRRLAGNTVSIRALDGQGHHITLHLRLDEHGFASRTLPAPDWSAIFLTHPTSIEHRIATLQRARPIFDTWTERISASGLYKALCPMLPPLGCGQGKTGLSLPPLPNRFRGTPVAARNDETIEIRFTHPGLRVSTVSVVAKHPTNHSSVTLRIRLDSKGRGSTKWRIPAGWPSVLLTQPTSADHGVIVIP